MDRYKKYAIIIQLFSYVIIFVDVVLTTSHWLLPRVYSALYNATGLTVTRQFDVIGFSLGQKLSGFIVEAFATALLVYGLVLVIQLMNYLKKKQYFTSETITLLKKITKISLIYTVYSVVCSSILSVITSLQNKPGERMISIGFGTLDVINIMMFCCLFLVLTIFQKGYELKHEQELTI